MVLSLEKSTWNVSGELMRPMPTWGCSIMLLVALTVSTMLRSSLQRNNIHPWTSKCSCLPNATFLGQMLRLWLVRYVYIPGRQVRDTSRTNKEKKRIGRKNQPQQGPLTGGWVPPDLETPKADGTPYPRNLFYQSNFMNYQNHTK